MWASHSYSGRFLEIESITYPWEEGKREGGREEGERKGRRERGRGGGRNRKGSVRVKKGGEKWEGRGYGQLRLV